MADRPVDDDDPTPEWFAPPPTRKDGPRLPLPNIVHDPITEPHPVVGDMGVAFTEGRQQGYDKGYTDGYLDGRKASDQRVKISRRSGQDEAFRVLEEVLRDRLRKDRSLQRALAEARSKLPPV